MMRTAIVFLAAAAAAHEVQELHGAGTTNPSKLFWELLGLMEARAKEPIHATYRAVGSSTGQKEFLGASNGNVALNHFGAGDIPMTNERYTSVVDAGRSMVHIPFAMGGIGVFHSCPVSGVSLHLDACVLAKIFSAQIASWDHDEIAALNPGVDLPSLPIKVVHRTKGSSSTAGFTEYMAATCGASWTLSTGSSLDDWPASTYSAQGSDGMSEFISSNEGAIGYIDAGHGHEHGLSEVALLNKAGVYVTTLDADIGNAATVALASGDVIPDDPSADFSEVNLYDQDGASTFPITMISYLYLDKDLSGMDASSAALLMAFVRMLLSEEGQALAEDNMFVKLPASILVYNNATLETITLPSDYVGYTFESATLVEEGAADTVISGKRQSYESWRAERMETDISTMQAQLAEDDAAEATQAATIAALEATVATLETKLAAAETTIATLSNGGTAIVESEANVETSTSSGADPVAIAGLVISILALLVGGYAVLQANNNATARRPVQREISFPKTSTTSDTNGVSMTKREAV